MIKLQPFGSVNWCLNNFRLKDFSCLIVNQWAHFFIPWKEKWKITFLRVKWLHLRVVKSPKIQSCNVINSSSLWTPELPEEATVTLSRISPHTGHRVVLWLLACSDTLPSCRHTKRCHICCTHTLRQTQDICSDENVRGRILLTEGLFLELLGIKSHMRILHLVLWPCLEFPQSSVSVADKLQRKPSLCVISQTAETK